MQTITTNWLQSIEALKDVPAEQLQWLIDNSRHYLLKEGDYLFKSGEPIVGTHIIVKGRLRLFIPGNNGVREIGYFEEKEIAGYLPYSRGFVASGTGQVVEDIEILTFPIEKIKDLIVNHFELTQALVHVMTTRVRDFTAFQQQNEKMMALGKLSAGLAHELNNPAAAIVRGSTSLKKHLQLLPETFKKVIAIKMSDEHVDAVNNKMFEVLARKERPVLTLMQKKEREDDLADCLLEKNIDNVEDIAENFVEFGFSDDDMREFTNLIPDTYLSPVLNWINNNLVTEKMVNDIQEASQRISDLVASVKTFTHMDRGNDKEYTDIHSGIRNTLTMLMHRIRKGNVEIAEEYDTTLPRVKAFVGELNQVWTNLIDNALDAMELNKKGILRIRTERDREFVKVSVTDNGPGIPEEVRSKIFDPFFTTKEIGKGTGLGLDVVTRIVKQHNGSIKVKSVPGETTFVVCFPIDG
jgi:signal transduction histidine kinase